MVVGIFPIYPAYYVNAQTSLGSSRPTVNIFSQDFKFVVCDGPDLSKIKDGAASMIVRVGGKEVNYTPNGALPNGYVPCDFNGLMKTVQHFIDIAIVAGVIVALGSFCYIGYLYMTGKESNISTAKKIFPKIFWGFVLMIASWFIVYQLLSWLGASVGKALLGNP